jgi:hypothetical protein
LPNIRHREHGKKPEQFFLTFQGGLRLPIKTSIPDGTKRERPLGFPTFPEFSSRWIRMNNLMELRAFSRQPIGRLLGFEVAVHDAALTQGNLRAGGQTSVSCEGFPHLVDFRNELLAVIGIG